MIEGETLQRVTVTLPRAYVKWARAEGDGNVSEGLRRLLEELDQLLGERAAAARAMRATARP